MAEGRGLRAEVRETLRLAGPLILGQLAGVLVTFVDTVMSGHLSALALASVAAGTAISHTVYLFGLGILHAVSPIVAELRGAGRESAIGAIVRQSLWIALVMAGLTCLVFRGAGPLLVALDVRPELHEIILGYLTALMWGTPAMYGFLSYRFLCEGMGVTRPIMHFGLLGLAVNVVANYGLIYGKWGLPALGAVGCGHATSAVWWVECLGLALYLRHHPRLAPLAAVGVEAPRRRPLAEILRVGLPIGSAFFVEVSMFAGVALLMGSIGAVPAAAHQIAINVAAFIFMFSLGVSLATTVRVGHALGRRDHAATERAGWVGIGLALSIQLSAAGALLLWRRSIAGIYTHDPAVLDLAAQLLLLAAIFQLSDGLQVSAAGALRGLKDTKTPMLITVVAYWVVGLPLGYWLAFPQGLGPRGLWIGFIAGLSVAAALLAARFRQLSHRVVSTPR